MFSKRVVASLMVGSLGLLSTGAMAEEANLTGCLHMQKQVAQALDSGQQSPSYKDASDLQRSASQFCQAGLYQQGLTRYAKALQLLGKVDSASR
jgi:hypothetical protein